jgi:hypothetical protein
MYTDPVLVLTPIKLVPIFCCTPKFLTVNVVAVPIDVIVSMPIYVEPFGNSRVTARFPSSYSCAAYKLPPTPAPPATFNAPVTFEVAAVVLLIIT